MNVRRCLHRLPVLQFVATRHRFVCHETRAGLKIVAREHIIVAKIVCWPLLFVVVVVAVGSIVVGGGVVVGVGVC